jgi:hypothetical protein
MAEALGTLQDLDAKRNMAPIVKNALAFITQNAMKATAPKAAIFAQPFAPQI